jgi:murein DD-endopeptidase MepM/ murein hydrolase activator NlpD
MALSAAAVFPLKLYGEDKVYTVQKGETFYSIARSFGVRPEDLMKHNGITDPVRLQAGQRLRIPAADQAGTAATAGAVGSSAGTVAPYRVVRGDTLYGIAQRFSVTVEALREANSLSANYVLREGDSLRLPSEARIPADARIPPNTGVAAAGSTAQSQAARTAAAAPKETASGTAASSARWPVNARELSYMTGKLSGVVITGAKSEQVQSLMRGTVLSAGPFQGFGRVVIVQVEGGYLYVYGGCESLSVKEGDKVGPGTELGKLGIDAASNKPQLFFMVYRSNTPVDPAKAPRA